MAKSNGMTYSINRVRKMSALHAAYLVDSKRFSCIDNLNFIKLFIELDKFRFFKFSIFCLAFH